MANFLHIEKHSDFFDLFNKYKLQRWFNYKDFNVNETNFRTYFYPAQLDIFKGKDDTDTKLRRELRGITFDLDNDIIVARPMHKFFNIQEVENYDVKNIISVQTKIDGSMIHPFLAKGQVIFKSKKSPSSAVAETFNKFIKEKDFFEQFLKFNKILLLNNFTPIYEFYHPKHRIILQYDKPFVKLLAIRENFSGNYLEFNTIEDLKNKLNQFLDLDKFDFLTNDFIPERWNYDFSKVLELTKQKTNFEGFVIVNDKSERYKVKTQWYFKAHFYGTTGTKTLFSYWQENKLDDLKSFAHQNNLSIILENVQNFEKKLNKLLSNLEKARKHLLDDCKCNEIDKKKLWFYLNDKKKKFVQDKKSEEIYSFVISLLMKNLNLTYSQIVETIKSAPFKKVKKML